MASQKITPTIPFTAAAYAHNQAEFARLTEERKEVLVRLQTAREMGDLSENGAYIYAKLELGNIGRQLRYLEHVLTHGYVADATAKSDVADFGHTVTLKNSTKELSFMLVSEHESNPVAHKLSLQSPIGQAVHGKRVGDEVIVTTPAGVVKYQLTALV